MRERKRVDREENERQGNGGEGNDREENERHGNDGEGNDREDDERHGSRRVMEKGMKVKEGEVRE